MVWGVSVEELEAWLSKPEDWIRLAASLAVLYPQKSRVSQEYTLEPPFHFLCRDMMLGARKLLEQLGQSVREKAGIVGMEVNSVSDATVEFFASLEIALESGPLRQGPPSPAPR